MRKLAILLTLSVLPLILTAQTGYVQEGKASFYADKFEGRTTASGERYSHARNTCAHLTLPFGTLVRVTNLSNDKSVVVRVNDRGPFVPNRIIDLSRSAAETLDFVSDGIADVKIEVIDEEGQIVESPRQQQQAQATRPRPAQQQPNQRTEYRERAETPERPTQAVSPPAKPSVVTGAASRETSDTELYELNVKLQKPQGFAVQIGSYKELVNLLRLSNDISSSLNETVRVQVTEVNGERVYRLLVGKFRTRREADAFRNRATQLYPDCFIVELK